MSSPVRVEDVEQVPCPDDWSDELIDAARKYVTITRDGSRLTVRNRHRYAGVVVFGSLRIYLPPPMDAPTFLGMILAAHGLDDTIRGRSALGRSNDLDSFNDVLSVIAALVVAESERVAAGHIAQGYIERQERLSVLRGRPMWHASRKFPPDGRILCRFTEKSTDVDINRVVLAGTVLAGRHLVNANWRRRQKTQRFIWSSLAQDTPLTPVSLVRARRSMSRLTRDYDRLLDLIGMLAFGESAAHATCNAVSVPVPVFNLPSLFEAVTARLLNLAVGAYGWGVEAQASDARAITDGAGNPYRSIRPDVLIHDDQRRVVAVVDSKFKPQYLSGGPGLNRGNKVTSGDLYQMFFYAERLRRLGALPSPVPSFILAPRFGQAVPPAQDALEIQWQDSASVARGAAPGTASQEARLVVIPVDLAHAVRALSRQDSEAAQQQMRLLIDAAARYQLNSRDL